MCVLGTGCCVAYKLEVDKIEKVLIIIWFFPDTHMYWMHFEPWNDVDIKEFDSQPDQDSTPTSFHWTAKITRTVSIEKILEVLNRSIYNMKKHRCIWKEKQTLIPLSPGI